MISDAHERRREPGPQSTVRRRFCAAQRALDGGGVSELTRRSRDWLATRVAATPTPGPNRINPLEVYFRSNDKRIIYKWLHYFEIYDRHFARFRGTDATIVEFGVFHGGSLQMWREYFGPRARIVGVDVDPRCRRSEEPGTAIFIGDQEDRTFLRSLTRQVGTIDVVIDDGGHTMGQQIATFEGIYPRMSRSGVYLVEDLHTSYWPEYGGGHRRPGTFVEYAKGLADQLTAWHSREPALAVNRFTRCTKSMHWYDSVIVFERGRVKPPTEDQTGNDGLDAAVR